jgi:hypothetical protein
MSKTPRVSKTLEVCSEIGKNHYMLSNYPMDYRDDPKILLIPLIPLS